MINKNLALKIQKISDAYVRLVKKETGADMVCQWGVIEGGGSKIMATGMSMSNKLEGDDMEAIYFHMQRNLFLNLRPDEFEDETI